MATCSEPFLAYIRQQRALRKLRFLTVQHGISKTETEQAFVRQLTAQARVRAGAFDQQALVTSFLRGLKPSVRVVLCLERKRYTGSRPRSDFIERAGAIVNSHKAIHPSRRQDGIGRLNVDEPYDDHGVGATPVRPPLDPIFIASDGGDPPLERSLHSRNTRALRIFRQILAVFQ